MQQEAEADLEPARRDVPTWLEQFIHEEANRQPVAPIWSDDEDPSASMSRAATASTWQQADGSFGDSETPLTDVGDSSLSASASSSKEVKSFTKSDWAENLWADHIKSTASITKRRNELLEKHVKWGYDPGTVRSFLTLLGEAAVNAGITEWDTSVDCRKWFVASVDEPSFDGFKRALSDGLLLKAGVNKEGVKALPDSAFATLLVSYAVHARSKRRTSGTTDGGTGGAEKVEVKAEPVEEVLPPAPAQHHQSPAAGSSASFGHPDAAQPSAASHNPPAGYVPQRFSPVELFAEQDYDMICQFLRPYAEAAHVPYLGAQFMRVGLSHIYVSSLSRYELVQMLLHNLLDAPLRAACLRLIDCLVLIMHLPELPVIRADEQVRLVLESGSVECCLLALHQMLLTKRVVTFIKAIGVDFATFEGAPASFNDRWRIWNKRMAGATHHMKISEHVVLFTRLQGWYQALSQMGLAKQELSAFWRLPAEEVKTEEEEPQAAVAWGDMKK